MEFPDARSLTDFLRHHRDHVERLQRTGEAEVLTIAGRPALVVQGVDEYWRVIERLRFVEGVVGLFQARASATLDWEKGLGGLRAKHGLPA